MDGPLDEDEASKFLAHASTLIHLRHPQIVPVLDFGVENGTAFLVMDYAPNGTLRQRHPRGARVPLDTIVSYVKQLASALQYVHQHNLVHRDIKPHNMLLGANHEVMLSDFGIAVVSRSIGPIRPGVYDFEGTVPYAAPEQLQGKPRRASDQYALGVVVYEWLSGDWPFSGSFEEITHQHLFVPPPRLHEKGIVISPAVEQVLMKTLEKEPDARFTTIEDFAEALEWAARQEHIRADGFKAQPLSKRQFISPLPFPKDTP
ncbi:MAG: serine/threonine protein kinase, partial [Chloroflexi bacterium]|nr:serine/threonine protein kinase [Chloroflexota bacterium]